MAQNQKNIAGTVTRLLEPKINEMGYDLWDVEYVKEGARYYLRITIDSPQGIGIEDCEAVHRAIDPMLDEADPIESSYYLEVSSPGIERVLRKTEHFVAVLGEEILCKLFRPLNGSKTLQGELQAVSDDLTAILLLPKGAEEPVVVPFTEIAKANVVFEF